MIDKNIFKKCIATVLKTSGFSKKGRQSWYLHGKDSVIVFNLQKSNWDEMYYMNIGIWLKVLGEAAFPLHNHCHLQYRVESLFPKQRETIITSCSLEESSIEHLESLSIFIENQLIPFLQECTNENKLKELFSQGALDNGLVMLAARQHFSGQ
jgi:hypothetical protein